MQCQRLLTYTKYPNLTLIAGFLLNSLCVCTACVCVHICLYVYIYTCMHVYMYICMQIQVYICVTSMHECVYTHACMHTHMYTHTYIHRRVHMHAKEQDLQLHCRLLSPIDSTPSTSGSPCGMIPFVDLDLHMLISVIV